MVLLKLLPLKARLLLTSETREIKIGIRLCDGNKAKTVTVFAYQKPWPKNLQTLPTALPWLLCWAHSVSADFKSRHRCVVR